jgi:hypothetical protein
MEILELIPRILNHLTPAEERVYLRLWAKTYAVGQATCRATFEDLARGSALSWSTTKTALVKLEGRGLIEIARFHKAPCVFTVQCIVLAPSDPPVAFGTSQTLELLTEADRAMLREVKRSLSPAKILQYKEIARQEGTELDEEILFAMFGPERLKAYRAFFPHRL